MIGPFTPGSNRESWTVPFGTKLKEDRRLAVGFCIGYRDGIVAWTGALTLLANAPALDELVVSTADFNVARLAT